MHWSAKPHVVSEEPDSQSAELQFASAKLPGESGQSAELQCASAELRFASAKLPGESAKLLGESAKVLGESAKLPDESGKILGESANLPGESAKLLGGSAKLPGESAVGKMLVAVCKICSSLKGSAIHNQPSIPCLMRGNLTIPKYTMSP